MKALVCALLLVPLTSLFAADAKNGPVKLRSITLKSGRFGQNGQTKLGGYLKLLITPFADFAGDKSITS
jgi:hypothetical protein